MSALALGSTTRRVFVAAALALVATACTPDASSVDPDVRRLLAPTGSLRVGLYAGTPTSILPASGTEGARGVGHDLGREFASYLGVPFAPVVFARNDEVQAAMRAGTVDIVFTNATPDRARDMNFAQPHLDIELGDLVPPGSPIGKLADVDRTGMRIGVTERSTSDGRLTREFKAAQVVRLRTLGDGIAALNEKRVDAYATNKATLFEMGDRVPGSRVLDGQWGLERHAMGMPKGREAGLDVARRFVERVVKDGQVRAAIDRAGLRGAIVAAP